MKKALLIAFILCVTVSFALAEEAGNVNGRCESCLTLVESLQKGLPELFGQDAAFAAAGSDLKVWTPTQGGLIANPNKDLALTGVGGPPSMPGITSPPPPPPHGGGCFLAGTPITMADGSTKLIEKIKVGDMVLAYNEAAQKMQPDKVTQLFRHPKEGVYLIVNSHLKVTPIHRVLSKGKWIEIGKLQVGDSLTNAKGENVAIKSIAKVTEPVDIYNFEVNPLHTYVAGGYVVHNKKVYETAVIAPHGEDGEGPP